MRRLLLYVVGLVLGLFVVLPSPTLAQPPLGPPDPSSGQWEGGGLWPRVFVPRWKPEGRWGEIGSVSDGHRTHRVYLDVTNDFVVTGSVVEYWMAYDAIVKPGEQFYVVLRQRADCSEKSMMRATHLALLAVNPYVRVNPDDMLDTHTKRLGSPKYISLIEIPAKIGMCGSTPAGDFGVALCNLVREAACGRGGTEMDRRVRAYETERNACLREAATPLGGGYYAPLKKCHTDALTHAGLVEVSNSGGQQSFCPISAPNFHDGKCWPARDRAIPDGR